MWKLALNHANILLKQQTVGKMSDHELLSLDNSGSGWGNVLLISGVVAIRMSWYAFFEKNSHGGGRLFWIGEYTSNQVI